MKQPARPSILVAVSPAWGAALGTLALAATLTLGAAGCDEPPLPVDTGPRPIEVTGPIGQPPPDENPLVPLFGTWRAERIDGLGSDAAVFGPVQQVRLELGAERVRLDGVPLPPAEAPSEDLGSSLEKAALSLGGGGKTGARGLLGNGARKSERPRTEQMLAAPKNAENISSGYRVVAIDGPATTVRLADRLGRFEPHEDGRLAFTDLKQNVTMIFVRVP